MIKRREFIAGLGGAAVVWPFAARAQQPALPVVGWVSLGSADAASGYVAAFRKGLGETGYVEGQNVTVEYHYLEGQYDRLPALMADLLRRRVAVIATPANTPGSIAAKAATATIPVVFSVAEDPVKLGLVASLARPGGNATGFNSFAQEVNAKRLGFLHELVPRAARVAVLVNPANARVTRHLGASRRALFEELEREALKRLPAEPYVYAEWKECRVGLDYHVEVEKHYYSAPYQLLRETVWARITAAMDDGACRRAHIGVNAAARPLRCAEVLNPGRRYAGEPAAPRSRR